MWSTHVRVRVNPGSQEIYERWKIMEGTAQLTAPGFVKRTLLRSRTDPTIFYYQSFWQREQDSTVFSQTPAFAELAQKYDPRAAFAEPMKREDCEIVIDELAAGELRPRLITGQSAWVIHEFVHAQPDHAADYERWKTEEGKLMTRAAGFIKRTLLRSQEDSTRYFYQSFWEAKQSADTFGESKELQSLLAQFGEVKLWIADKLREECDVVFDELAK